MTMYKALFQMSENDLFVARNEWLSVAEKASFQKTRMLALILANQYDAEITRRKSL